MDKIDNLDRKILGILSKNARIPFKDVAAECGVSRAAIHQRVQHLVEDGYITGSGFDVNPKSLGYSTCTYVGINLERGNMYKKVVERLLNIPESWSAISPLVPTPCFLSSMPVITSSSWICSTISCRPSLVSFPPRLLFLWSRASSVRYLLFWKTNKWKTLIWSRTYRVCTPPFPKRSIVPS